MASTSSASTCPAPATNKRKRSLSPSGESCPSSPDEAGGSGGSCSNSTDLSTDVLKTSNDVASILGPSRKKKKCVSFDGVTVYYFRRSQGFTSVPSQGGSTLGMLPKHELKKSFSLCDYSKEQERIHRIILKRQLVEKRQQQLLETGVLELSEDISEEEIEDELNSINISDYYFLQPIPTKQRRALLRIAGIKKVDNIEKMDLKKIRISRESCGCDCRNFCNPTTCACAQAGIKCQVDRLSFPCGCTKDGCGNPTGRVEFNPVRVRTHFLHTIMRLDSNRNTNGGEGPSSSDGKDEVRNMLLRTSGEYTTASCTKPCCDNLSTEGDSTVTGYASSLGHYNNGQGGCAAVAEANHLFHGQYDDHGIEGNIPVEVKQHLNVQDIIPHMLHYNDADDGLLHHHHHAGLSCSNDSVSPLATYPQSDDSILTSSSDASSSDSYQYNQCDQFAFKEPSTYTEISKASEACVTSSVDSSFTEVPSSKLSTLDEGSDLQLGLPLCSNSTFTDLNAHITTFAGDFGSNAATQPSSPCTTSSPSSYGNGMIMDSRVSQTEQCHFDKGAISSTTPDSTPCTTTSSYTILSALNAIDPLDETELATSKIGSVAVSMGDNFSHDPVSHSEFHELQNCSSAEAVVSGMVTVNCPDVKLTQSDSGGEEQQMNCFDSVKNIEEQSKDEMVASAQLI